MNEKPIVYVKAGCPWCIDAENYLKKKGIAYTAKEVRSDPAAMAEMVELSGQSKAPTLKWGDLVLADFGVDELVPFLAKHGLA
ncbi:glutaredoxin family protein [Pelagicoccus sp. SDUM812005]|uniref:glutaredoxin family protein n=1 Tax=Pelagicoccus sp. SDUM812005 TaxID=3041257 RepID=UPI00280D73C7|nr:glutaredoxin family protein [Pelagicoccus sp. SDUM812005]MDQ8180184.1 glutaredoxin family protein [Pelagicoccus sp. SDUM812005]